VLMPNSSAPFTASRSLIICHRGGNVSPRYFERRHASQGIDRCVREQVERAEPPICRRPQHALQPVQSGQYQRDGADVADHARNRPQPIRLVVSVLVAAGSLWLADRTLPKPVSEGHNGRCRRL
jgi:hypothetical protein